MQSSNTLTNATILMSHTSTSLPSPFAGILKESFVLTNLVRMCERVLRDHSLDRYRSHSYIYKHTQTLCLSVVIHEVDITHKLYDLLNWQ